MSPKRQPSPPHPKQSQITQYAKRHNQHATPKQGLGPPSLRTSRGGSTARGGGSSLAHSFAAIAGNSSLRASNIFAALSDQGDSSSSSSATPVITNRAMDDGALTQDGSTPDEETTDFTSDLVEVEASSPPNFSTKPRGPAVTSNVMDTQPVVTEADMSMEGSDVPTASTPATSNLSVDLRLETSVEDVNQYPTTQPSTEPEASASVNQSSSIPSVSPSSASTSVGLSGYAATMSSDRQRSDSGIIDKSIMLKRGQIRDHIH